MTMTPFTCDTFAEQLAAHLERDLAPERRAAMDTHARECRACGALQADLAAIARDAAALPMLVPERDLWAGIEARIGTEVRPIGAAAGRRAAAAPSVQRGSRRWWAHPALAAAALVGITAGVTHYATREAMDDALRTGAGGAPTVNGRGTMIGARPPFEVADASEPSVAGTQDGVAAGGARPASDVPAAAGGSRGTGGQPVAGGRRQAATVVPVAYREGDIAALDSLYYREIVRLRQLLNTRRTVLDSGTVAVIDRNMLVIDRAIQECRAALAADPGSRFLNEQLNEALESKIELLRTAAMMPVGS